MACLDLNSISKDPRFDVLRKWYPTHDDLYLATTLAQYWDSHPGNDDWFPTSVSDHRKFTYFMNHGKQKERAKETKSTTALEDVSAAYETLAWAYSPTMLQDRLDLLASHFKSYVDSLVEIAKRETGKNISRSKAIRDAGGYSGVMGKIFDSFNAYTLDDMLEDAPVLPEDSEDVANQKRAAAQYRLNEYKKMAGMRNLLAAQAAPVIGSKENLVVAYSGMEIDLKSVDEYEQTLSREEDSALQDGDVYNEDTVNPDEDTTQQERDVEATKGDRYVDFRTLRLHETLSTKAKEMLAQIPMLDSQGNVITDDMGFAKYLDGKQVAYALIYSLENSTEQTMMEDLQAATDRYPFLQGVIDFIEQNPDYATTLWCNFHRIGYTYSYIKAEGGSYKVSTSNTKAQGYSLMRSAGNYMRSGFILDDDYSVYDDRGRVRDVGGWRQVPDPQIPGRTKGAFTGIVGDILNTLAPIKKELRCVNTVERSKIFRNVKLPDEVKNRYTEAGAIEGMQLFVDENPIIIKELTKALRGLGFDVSERQVADAAVKPLHDGGLKYLGVNDSKYTDKNRLCILYDNLSSIYKRIGELGGQAATRIYDTASTELRQINSVLALSLFDELEPRTLENKKQLNTFNHASLLRETFAALRNNRNLSDKDYRKFIQNEYLQYEGFALEGASAFGSGVDSVSGWLSEVLNGNRNFNVLTQTHFNGVEYADMSRHQMALAYFLNWLKPQPGSGGFRSYAFPIEADYESAFDYIQAPTYRTGESAFDQPSPEAQDSFLTTYGSSVKPLMLNGGYNIGPDNEILNLVANEVLIEYQRILAIQERKKIDPKGLNRNVLETYEDRGVQFQIFPEMNTNGFLERYSAAKTTAEKDQLLKLEVASQLQKILEQDYKNINSSGMLKNKLLGKIYTGENPKAYNFFVESGRVEDLGAIEKGLMQDFALNMFYARLQATKLVYGDLAHFNGILDFEKRSMMAHAPGSPVYTNATYHGKPLGMKDYENVMYLGDESSRSYFIKGIEKAIDKSTFLTPEQKKKAKAAYLNIKSTDGQGFRTLDSARELLIATDGATGTIWTEEHERAYQRIKNHNFTKKDADLFLNLSVNFQNIKPVLTGYQRINKAEGDVYAEVRDENGDPVLDENGNPKRELVVSQKPIKTPVLHKYSEVILLPHELLGISPQMESSMYGGLSMAADELGRKVDLYLFHSGVKVGAHDLVDPFGFVKQKDKDGNETKKDLLDENGNKIRRTHSAEEVRDYIVNSAKNAKSIQQIPFKYLRIAASTGAHTKDTEISWSSQAQKNLWSNYDDKEEISIRGKKMTLAEAHETNNRIDVANIKEAYNSLLQEIGDLDKLEELLQTELALKSYNSKQMRWALTRLKNGDFVSPLGNPSIMRGVEQLLLGLMKKRLTRPTGKGANIIQITSLGLDHDPFNPNEAMDSNHKLDIEFDSKGNLVAIDCYVSIHDSRLEQFADENGAITPERLEKLKEEGVIDENILKFVAYRTPSDDLHSILPLRIKGFVSGVGGANIIVPKEVMKMTGHDFDGDKLRCHFIEFDEVWDESLIADDYDELTKFNPVRASTVLAINPKALNSLEDYVRFAKSQKNPWRNEYVKIVSEKYDYGKSAFENSQTARDNAKVELAFGRLTSDSGSSLVFVPGGADDTSAYAKTVYLTKQSRTNQNLRTALHARGIKLSDVTAVYKALSKLSLDELVALMDVANGATTPFSFSHALDSFDYLIGGARMIDVNAMYSSAFKLFQKMNFEYRPKTYKNEDGTTTVYELKLFNHEKNVKSLFDITNAEGLSSMTYARNVNAAVDNGKDPNLGYLNQVPELAELTFFLAATNNSEEEIHLFLNQPVIVEAVRRMKDSKKDLYDVLGEIADELTSGSLDAEMQKFVNENGNINQKKSLETIATKTVDDYVRAMVVQYEDLPNAQNYDVFKMQLATIGYLFHTKHAVNALANLAKLTRPEATTSGVASTVSGTTVKWDKYQQFCKQIQEEGKNFPIKGAEIVLPLAIGEWTDDETLKSMTDSRMGYVQVLNSLLVDGSFDVMSWFFPQARDSWRDAAISVAKMYHYRNLQEGIVRKVMQDMFLFKLLWNKGFLRDIEGSRKDVLVNMPYRLDVLKIRIRRAKESIERGEEVLDKAVIPLIGNQFLEKIEVYRPETKQELPRLRFMTGGPTIDSMADEISTAWSQLERSRDKDIQKVGRDLYLYNIFTNGLGYGMYEFAHFAPMNVVMKIPGLMKAMNSIARSNFRLDSEEGQRFRHQYVLNHWGDKRLLYTINTSAIPMQGAPVDMVALKKIKQSEYFIQKDVDAQGNAFYVLKKVTLDDSAPFGFTTETMPKLGIRGFYGQITLQYNPEVDTPTPLQTGDDSNWHFDENDPYAEADISDQGVAAAREKINNEANTEANIKKRFLSRLRPVAEQMDKSAAAAVPSNEKTLAEAEDGVDKPIVADNGMHFYKGKIEPAPGTIFVFGSNPEGRHGAGAARVALQKFYARYGQGEGIQGNAYAIPTKDLRVKANNSLRSIAPEQIIESIRGMYEYARHNPDKIMKVAYTNGPEEATLNGYTGREMYDMFEVAGPVPGNVWFSEAWLGMANGSDPADQVRTPEAPETDVPAPTEADYRESMPETSAQDRRDAALKGMFANRFGSMKQLNIVQRVVNENGEAVVKTVGLPISPYGINEARRQAAYVELNRRLREILRQKGIAVGTLSSAEELLSLNGITDFDTPKVLANGLIELVRLSNGINSQYALPEEFAHIAIEMAGHDQPLIRRLIEALKGNDAALASAFDGGLDAYINDMGENATREALAVEAAGKLVAKHLFQQQALKGHPFLRLINRVSEFIKSVFRRFSTRELHDAIYETERNASRIARNLIDGRLLDGLNVEDIRTSGQMKQIKLDITERNSALERILKNELKKLEILQKRKSASQRDEKTPFEVATLSQIKKLEDAIRNDKSEKAILDYFTETLNYLSEVEKDLDDIVKNPNANRSAGFVCRKLADVRDTIDCYAAIATDISKAIQEKEIAATKDLTDIIGSVQRVVSQFYLKCNDIGMQYAVEAMRGVYGDGRVIQLGKDRGKMLTVEEMLRTARRDVSLASRWVHSLADSGDEVLMAIAQITREAKQRSRATMRMVKPRIEKAFADYVRATGTRDQNFMFERDVNGKRTGRYVSEDKIKSRFGENSAQHIFYKEMMAIKAEVDKRLPPTYVAPDKIVMLRRRHTIGDILQADNKWEEALDGVRNAVMDTSSDVEFDNKEVTVDFLGNRVDRLIPMFCNKGVNETYDDMTDDVASSILAYAGMGYEYAEMSNVVFVLENLKYMAAMRDVNQSFSGKPMRETIGDPDPMHDTDANYFYHRPYTVKQARTNLQKMVDDFMYMHVYGHRYAGEGNFQVFGNDTGISKQKTANLANAVATYSQMALNLQQRISNVATGATNIIIESVGGGIYNAKDVAWATKEYVKQTGDRLKDTGRTETDNYLSLFAERFDVHQDNGHKDPKYKKGRASKVFNFNLAFAGLQAGEDYLAITTALAAARNYKVKDAEGHEHNLYEAYEVKYLDSANKTGAYLELKKGWTKADGSEITDKDERAFTDLVAGLNFQLQGIYNLDDKSAMQMYALGSLLIMYRKWIAPALKRRYSRPKYNILTQQEEEGYYRTLGVHIYDSLFGVDGMTNASYGLIESFKLNYSKLTDYEKSNIRRALTEAGTLLATIAAIFLLEQLPPDKDDQDVGGFLSWAHNQMLLILLRERNEIGSIAPTPLFFKEVMNTLGSPFAAWRPVQRVLQGFLLLWPPSYWTPVKSGRDAGHTKAYKYFWNLPVVSMYKQIQKVIDPTSVINYYKNNIMG